jgi:hypothetical protein
VLRRKGAELEIVAELQERPTLKDVALNYL